VRERPGSLSRTAPGGRAFEISPEPAAEEPADAAAAAPREAPSPALAWDAAGHFTLGAELSRGGMGRVVAAVDRHLGRTVAVKQLLGAGSDLARFEREAAITARLQHPSIVPIYEAGTLPGGEPFYAMRLISGRTLRDLVAEQPGLRERLALLPHALAMADAVAYAHGQGIIHRDLKPSNVVVGEFGETVVIDWGLAQDVRDVDDGVVAGTPAYMPPEQARGFPADRRADVWALGATIYHLLAGRPPYDGPTSDAVLEAVKTSQPPPLRRIAPAVPDELAALVDKAMERDPALRYPSARELADDLRRFQTGQLVGAYRYSAGALAARWARRHRAVLAVAAAALVVLAAGGAVAVRHVVAERDRANREAAAARSVASFMTGMFQVADPSEARGNAVTAREILDRAATQIQGSRTLDPDTKARLMQTMGTVYESLGLFARARPLVEAALASRRARLGADDPETLASLGSLATLDDDEGHYAEAEATRHDVLAVRRRMLGPAHPDTLLAMFDLARSYQNQGRYAEAEQLHRQALELRRRVLGPEHVDTLKSMHQLALAEDFEGQFPVAEKLDRELLAVARRVLGPDHPDTIDALNLLATTLRQQHRFTEAEQIYLEALAGRRRVLGPEHPQTLFVLENLGGVEIQLGRLDDAERYYREVLDAQRRVLGPRHPEVADSLYNLGCVTALRGDRRAALGYVREGVAIGLTPDVVTYLRHDSDCDALHGDPEFEALVTQAERRR
jgi:eukaryotic-like serine/threonine-protein kinase